MTQPPKKPMRQAMPTVAGWIDNLRAAFGADMIDAAIRAGIAGQHTFHAREGGREVGTPIPYDPAKAVKLSETVVGAMNLPKEKP
jgi:dienelactone hydrolase